MSGYYVYGHFTADTEEIFYIGQGRGKRKDSFDGRSEEWHKIAWFRGFTSKILDSSLTKDEALKVETKFILQYGRKDMGLGPLLNRTDGGLGQSGKIVSEETRSRISQSNTGKKHSDKTKRKQSAKAKERFSTPEARARLKEAINTPEAREKKSAAQTGKKRGPLSPEHKKKISETKRGIST